MQILIFPQNNSLQNVHTGPQASQKSVYAVFTATMWARGGHFSSSIAILLILLIKIIQLIRISALLCGNMIHFHSTSTQKYFLNTETFSLRPTSHNTSAGRVKSGGKSSNEGVPATVLLIRDPTLVQKYLEPMKKSGETLASTNFALQ